MQLLCVHKCKYMIYSAFEKYSDPFTSMTLCYCSLKLKSWSLPQAGWGARQKPLLSERHLNDYFH